MKWGDKALLAHSLVLQRPSVQIRADQEGTARPAPHSPPVLMSCGSWAEREWQSVPPSAQRRWLSPHPFFFAPSSPPVSGAATLQLFYPSVSDSEVFQRPQPCQRGAHTKGLFDFLFVFICQQRGRGAGEKELLGFKIFIWVASFSEELAPWNYLLSWGLEAVMAFWGAGGVGSGRRGAPQHSRRGRV